MCVCVCVCVPSPTLITLTPPHPSPTHTHLVYLRGDVRALGRATHTPHTHTHTHTHPHTASARSIDWCRRNRRGQVLGLGLGSEPGSEPGSGSRVRAARLPARRRQRLRARQSSPPRQRAVGRPWRRRTSSRAYSKIRKGGEAEAWPSLDFPLDSLVSFLIIFRLFTDQPVIL